MRDYKSVIITPPYKQIYIALADRCRNGNIEIGWLDLLRAFTCVIVVVCHTKGWLMSSEVNPIWAFLLSIIENVNVFFIISGALLLPIAEGGNWMFFKRRLIRLTGPFLLYSLGYFFIQHIYGVTDMSELSFELKWFWVDRLIGEHWFIFVLTGVYLMMPFMSPWLRTASKRQVEIFLLIWLAAMCLPFINIKAGVLAHNNSFEMTFLGSFYNYFGFAVAGYYIVRWPVREWGKVMKWWVFAFCSVLTFIIMPYFYFHFESWQSRLIPFQDLTITVVAKTFLIFVLFSSMTSISGWLSVVAGCVSKYSYSIYLCHPIFYKLVVPLSLPSVVDTPWSFPIVFAATFLTVWILSKTPVVGKYLI